VINNTAAFRSALLTWYQQHQRKLPWRTEPSLYRTVVSEFMLQQTQIKTALPYFERWMQRFPDFTTLADAESAVVLKHWEGLGYYNRARNLHKVAQWMRDAEAVPDTVEAWKALPGIGDYTAAAITSIAQGVPSAVVDGNVVRVLARLTNEQTAFANNAKAVDFFKDLANTLLDSESPGDANQAMMELGATVCTKGTPQCALCPLQSFCRGFAEGTVADLPKIQRAKREKVRLHRGLAIEQKKILLHKISSEAKRLKGHYEIPSLESLNLSQDSYGLEAVSIRRRAISNQSIEEHLFRVSIEGLSLDGDEALNWIDLSEINSILLSGPHRRWLKEYLQTLDLN
jgi:A/G-specific adenine glycosylase